MRAHALALLVLLLSAPSALAQGPETWEDSDGEFLRVQLVTVGRGPSLAAAWGHTGLLVSDDASGVTVFYNYGTLNVSDVAALAGVAVGTARYSVEGMDALGALKQFREEGRDVFLRELRLGPEARALVARQAANDSLPENKFYRYDGYFDNCATRVRDLIDAATGGALANATRGTASPLTVREEARRYLADRPLVDVVIDYGTGREADAPATLWDALFLPLALDDAVTRLTVQDASGRELPFVVRTVVYNDVDDAPLPPGPASRGGVALALGGGVALAFLALAAAARAGVPHAGRALSTSTLGVAVLLGLLGVLLVVRRLVGATTPTNDLVWVYTPLFLFLLGVPRHLRAVAWTVLGLAAVVGGIVVDAGAPHLLLAVMPAAGAVLSLTWAAGWSLTARHADPPS